MTVDFAWVDYLRHDVHHGFLNRATASGRHYHPQVILNGESTSVLRTLREELGKCVGFTFSVAFVTPRAIALLKQELDDFSGQGRIITSDYLGFNSPHAFAELKNLERLGIDVRLHGAHAFHPKGYIFEHPDVVTAMMGSSNLTENAIVRNHEWNLKVSAARGSDLADQLLELTQHQLDESDVLTDDWISAYAASYVPPAARPRRLPVKPDQTESADPDLLVPAEESDAGIIPNAMQTEALDAIEQVRLQGEDRAIVISATGTGKTILSALDVRAYQPKRMLFVVHREQILDRTIEEYQRVLGGAASDYGKLAGSAKELDRRFVFATVQTLSQTDVLQGIAPDAFDYVIVDEAHRAGAATYKRVLDHLSPSFLLGMTATPERSDGFNVFELFNYNVPYEIRLNHALEADMLSPFHYYGVADVQFDDGSTVTGENDLRSLISADRVSHVIDAIEKYGQAGVAPSGLIFCARKDEARELSAALNERTLRGEQLRTVALTGDDSVEVRESTVAALERGELDYILTVDIFNEGVDIPTVNQVIMLRQTQSAIIFVQQLGRGLRKAAMKEYLVVIDFIGNYANNYMIPIALFGDDSLNKESLRKKMIAAEESGVLPGLSSVRFDKVAQDRVLRSITEVKLDSMKLLKSAMQTMHNRLGRVPRLRDFYRFESVDPVLLATKKENYPSMVAATITDKTNTFSPAANRMLRMLSNEVFTAKRVHEFVLLRELLRSGSAEIAEIRERVEAAGGTILDRSVESAVQTLTLQGFALKDTRKYGDGLATLDGERVSLRSEFLDLYRSQEKFRTEVDDLVTTGFAMALEQYDRMRRFTPGNQYSRKEVMRLLGLPRSWESTVYGYKVDYESMTCPIFVTLHKSDEVSASTAYQDELLDRSTMRWFTRSRRTLKTREVAAIVGNDVELHVFVKKDDAEGSDFYYLGEAQSRDAEQATMTDGQGNDLNVVHLNLHFDQPIEGALFDYFHPVVTGA
ncbi:helicase [Zhihengliuella salsuginis]|uniref:Helicase n=2 Tax=Zhihengliuella salsuginis TaxID=578222 RepID=A0ABQ3GLW9_9MICC|nr:helicase [Zhihengliuella salsuginis]